MPVSARFNERILANVLDWVEHRTKSVFVVVALLLYAYEIGNIVARSGPIPELNEFLVLCLTALSIPFGVILLQELLELIASIAQNNLLSIRRQFEIVILVIALIFARFPLYASNTLSYALSALGVGFSTAALFLFYRISIWWDENRADDEGVVA